MAKFLPKIIDRIENSPVTFWFWLASFSAIIIIRILIENWLEGFRSRSGLFIFYEFTHTFLFFLIAYLLFLWILKRILSADFRKISNVLLWGYLIILTPPIADYIISHGKGFWSFYEFDGLKGLITRFFTFFGSTPEIGVTYGVRIEVAIAILFIGLYSFLKSKNILKSLFLFLLSYLVFFVLGTFPSWITIAVKGFSKGFLAVTDVDVAQMFLTPARIFSREIPDIVSTLNIKMSLVYSLVLIGIVLLGVFFDWKNRFLAFLKNARFPQLIYHGGLLMVGMGLAVIFTDSWITFNFFNVSSFLVLLSSIFCAWLASVVINDIQDKDIDKITNQTRPLATGTFTLEEYKTIGWILFLVSILFSAIVNFKIALLLLVYQAIAWLYSCWPLRLKRFAFVSTFVSAIASLLILFSGFILVSPEQNIKGLPFSIVALLVIGYTLALPIKDFKDVEGDKKNGVYTVPVLFGEQWGKIIVGAGIFLSFVLSVILFNEPRLFWWALFFGGLAFWIIINKSINPRRLPWWILGVVVLYGMIMMKVVFL
ncbi:MAG: UbiA family prenyltransferase [Candidatus Moranbacteria bacterium]|nr:UbiA family prenyltransferase [Candidatus Moranbacteria bacterium]